MRNVTICLPEEVHQHARIVAAEYGVSLSFLVASVLGSLPGVKRLDERIAFHKKYFSNRVSPEVRVASQRPPIFDRKIPSIYDKKIPSIGEIKIPLIDEKRTPSFLQQPRPLF